MGLFESRRIRASGVVAFLIALLLAIDVLAVAGIVAAREEAREAAFEDLRRSAAGQARATEAALATLRADLIFLGSSPRLEAGGTGAAAADPLQQRWARLETESALLLFAAGHPALVALAIADAQGRPRAQVARLEESLASEPQVVASLVPLPSWSLQLRLELDDGGAILAVVDPELLLQSTTPEIGGALLPGVEAAGGAGSSDLMVLEAVTASGWQGPEPLLLERRVAEDQVLGAVEHLAGRYRVTVLLNLLVVSLGLPLGVVAVRAARRAARLAAEGEHEEERRKLERSLWHQERLATVGRLAAGIAHEINNPLAGISNHLQLLEQDLAAGEIEAVRERLPRLRQGIERIAGITRRALRLAAPSRSEGATVDLTALAEETLRLVPGAEASVRISPPRDGTVAVAGDPAALGQLVTNLLLNAIDMQDDIEERPRSVEISIRSERGEAVLEVADRGPGIDPEVRPRLFEPFVSSRGSTGLGLAVCLGIVRDLGGTIEAEDRLDGGARFIVRLPLAERPVLEAS